MSMIGIPLTTYERELHYVGPGTLPTRTIDRYLDRLATYQEDIECLSRGYKEFDPFRHCSSFPSGFYETCDFEELCKIYGSSIFQLAYPFYDMFEKLPEYAIVRKIKSSLWRYGYTSIDTEWDTMVDAYNGIRNFSFGLPDFEVRLNYTRGYSAYSYTEFDPDMYLDGVFGFVVHYKGEPVMTIGFSFAKGRRLLISQVQMRKQKGNRFLFKLPTDRVMFVVSLMKKYFPKFRQYLVDGERLVALYIEQYQYAAKREREFNLPDPVVIAKAEAKVIGLQGEIGEQIRRTYQLNGGPWKLSPHRPYYAFDRHYFRIISA